MGGRLLADKLPGYETSHPGQLSLAIPLWEGAMRQSWGTTSMYLWSASISWCVAED